MRRRIPQMVFVIAGIVLGQALLYGPSLIGRKLLLPLDVLAAPSIYLPQADAAGIEPHNMVLSDLVFLFEPERRFAVSEFHSGHIPMWAPYHFAGAPFVWPKFSPLLFPEIVIGSPVVLVWVQLLCSLVAGMGMYLFCRRVLAVGAWPATILAWCYPLTYFFILSQGFTLILSVYWLPWILGAVDATVRRKGAFPPIGLCLATASVGLSGQLDMAGQVLAVSGGFAIWAWVDEYRHRWRSTVAAQAVMRLVTGWLLGLMLASPYVLPVLDYASSGARVSLRSAGVEERPPVGLRALPQIILPKIYGSSERGDIPLYPKGQNNLQESSAGAYAGILATLMVAPLAFQSRRHRGVNLFWVALAILGVSWSLNLPGVVWLMRLPGINLLSYNRLVFATAFSICALSAVGLEMIYERGVKWHKGYWALVLLLLLLCVWCGFRALVLPEPLRTELEAGLRQGLQSQWVRDLAGAREAKHLFSRNYALAAVLAGIGLAVWIYLYLRRANYSSPFLLSLLATCMAADLLWHAAGRATQCDPSLYYPRLPVLEQVSRAPGGRIIGYSCLPALLASTHALTDIRGYDPIVPGRFLELLKLSSDPRSTVFAYALAQRLTPAAAPDGQGGIRLHPILDMLNVRYVIFRGAPSPSDRPIFRGPDYFVLLNRSALERVFVPQRAEVIADDVQGLAKISLADFNPRSVVYVEQPIRCADRCSGMTRIVEEGPTRVKIECDMKTDGVVVLSDRWDEGWKAYLNGKHVPVVRANHSIRAVAVSAGTGSLEFRYEPGTFTLGLLLAGTAAMALACWVLVLRCTGTLNS